MYYGQHSACKTRKLNINYASVHGNYILLTNNDYPKLKFRLTISHVPNDSSFLPLVNFVKKASNLNSLNPVSEVFYASDTNTISFLNNDCSSTKAFIIYEKNGTEFNRRLFKENESGLFIEDTAQTKIVPVIAFKYIDDEITNDIQVHYPNVHAYHLFSSRHYITPKNLNVSVKELQ
jgi:hypothetical protein